MAKIAIISARGGSKRIPKKNIKLFLGKPIIAYSIEAALSSNLFDEVMVSTDNEEIKQIAETFGLRTEYQRPSHLATDDSGKLPVIEDLLVYEESRRKIK